MTGLLISILCDVILNVFYIVIYMQKIRLCLKPLIAPKTLFVSKKLLGVDIKNELHFLKIKYSILFSILVFYLFVIFHISSLKLYIFIQIIEIILIHTSIDIYQYFGNNISIFFQNTIEGKPDVKILNSNHHQIKSKDKDTNILSKDIVIEKLFLKSTLLF